MKYDTREEVERIGAAGGKKETDKRGARYRYLSSFWLYVEEDDYAFTPHARSGFWEAWVTRWISEELEHCEFFIDVGANVGYYTMMAGTSRVRTYAIEPNPSLYDKLYDSAAKNRCKDLVTIVPVALSDRRGMVRMLIPPKHSGGGWISNDDPVTVDFETFTVEQAPLDTTLKFGFTPKNILIKIDAEGSEPSIWDGMLYTWKEHNVVATLEWHGVRWTEAQRNEFADKLFQNKVSWIDHDGFEQPITKDWLLGNQDLIMIVVRKNVAT